MKNATTAVAVLTLSLAACGSKADLPTAEQVAKAYEMHMNANLVSELGQRIEIRGWDDLKVDCSADGPERVICVTGGTVDMVGFHGGKQMKPEPVPVPAQFDFTFAKQGNAWVPISAQKK
jgi:predicted small lipoprotein YifL